MPIFNGIAAIISDTSQNKGQDEMKTIAPNIKIMEVEEPMEVEDFQAVKQPTFASDSQETNWEKMTDIPAKGIDVFLIMGTINGETVATRVWSKYPLTSEQYKDILKIIYSCKNEQVTKQFDEALQTRIRNILEPDVQYKARIFVEYDFSRGVIASIGIYPNR